MEILRWITFGTVSYISINMLVRLLLFLLLSISYGHNGYGQEKPKFSEVNDQLGPNMLKIEGIVKETLSSPQPCTKNGEGSMIIKVNEVLYRGRAIKNTVALNQDLTLTISQALLRSLDEDEKVVNKGQRVLILASEKLCQDLYQTAYLALSLEIR